MTTEEALAYHNDAAATAVVRLKAHTWDERGPRFVPPSDDDPETWQGIAEYVYRLWIYEWHIEAVAALTVGGKPFYCPPCGDKHVKGWQARLCLDHAWEAWGYDSVLARSRDLDPRRVRRAEVAA